MEITKINQEENMVSVEVTRDKKVSFTMCSAIDLLNTLEKVVNNADIKFTSGDGKVKYTIEVKQTDLE